MRLDPSFSLWPLLEAKDSSEIENIVTTSNKLFQYAQEDGQADNRSINNLIVPITLFIRFVIHIITGNKKALPKVMFKCALSYCNYEV